MTLDYNQLDPSEVDYIAVADLAEVPNGERLFLEIDDFDIVLFNIAGKFFAIANVCSHDGGPLEDGKLEEEYEISCPRHGAHFDVRNGQALSLPAIVNISAYPVRVQGDAIEIGLPKE